MFFVILQWHLSGLMNSLCGLPFVLFMLCNWPTLSMSQRGMQDSMQCSLCPKWLSQKTIGKRLIAVFARVFERLAIVGERRAQESLHFPPSLPFFFPSFLFFPETGFLFVDQAILKLRDPPVSASACHLFQFFKGTFKKQVQPLTLFITLSSKCLLCCRTLRTIPLALVFIYMYLEVETKRANSWAGNTYDVYIFEQIYKDCRDQQYS